MKGDKEFREALEENKKEIEAEPDSLYGAHPFKRILIGFAGPFFNFIFTVIAFTIIAAIGYRYYTYSNKIIIDTENYENICTAAKDAGLLSGDKIIQIENKKIEDFSGIIEVVSLNPDKDLKIVVDRNGKNLTFNVHTELDKSTGSGKLGVVADSTNLIEKEVKGLGFFSSIKEGFYETFNSIGVTLKSLTLLFKGVDLDNAVSGPLRVTDMLGSTVKEGFKAGFRQGLISILNLMAIISISLFIMNLLPIPILDGGMILIALIELILRKKIHPKIQYYIQFIGLAFIIILFIIGIKGDLKFFLGRSK